MAWTEIVFQYDGSFDGFLCCIYESYLNKEFPIAFYGDEECFSLYAVRLVITEHEHARRVLRSIVKRSARAAELLQKVFLTCMEDKELHLYAFVRKLYAEGSRFLKNQSDPIYHPLVKAIRHMNGELEKLRGFVRFSDYNGVLGGEIEPKNRVLPLLRGHFCSRYANESFFIYDRTHRELLLYAKGRSRILPVDALHLTLPGEEEMQYRRLWKCFYETIAIRDRTNPRCQNTHMPKRYRNTMTEFLPLDYEAQYQGAIPPKTPAASANPAVPTGKSALEIPPQSGRSAVASAL
ncbi:MAG: TIGR03915 family putative DNA repair protein [Oscillospiraceae bacterium]|nr:TIGR03915 family putative DNA repair protein [Oscillospiraceae bacterium]